MDGTFPGRNEQASPQWYLIKTKPRAEELVQNNLRRYQINSYLPRLFTPGKGNSTLKSASLFPGYIFFQLEHTSPYWNYVRWAPGVSYILHDDAGATPLPDSLVEEIARREEYRRKTVLADLARPFEANERLQITSGPFAGLAVVFDQPLTAQGRVQVLVQILGRLTRIALEKDLLQRMSHF